MIEVISLTAFASLALTALLAYALRGRFSVAILCVIGIGVAPLLLYLMIFTAFYLGGSLPISTVPFWYGFKSMALVAPNYLLCFVIAGAFLIAWGIRRSIEEGVGVVFVILVPVHGLGLYFSYWFLTHPGSL